MERRLNVGVVGGKDLEGLRKRIDAEPGLARSRAGIEALAEELDFRFEQG